MTAPDWTSLTSAEKQTAIRPLWMEGKSASEIASQFTGATRNSIISALHRGKMTGSSNKPVKAAATKAPKISNKVQGREKPRSAVTLPKFSAHPDAEPPSASVMEMIENNRPPLAGTTPISILDLPNRPGVLCRFPVVGGYCGQPSGDKTHCKAHHGIMYRETDKIRMPKEARL